MCRRTRGESGGGGGGGEHSWTQLLVSNSQAPECSDPLCRVCELAPSSENRGNTPVQLFFTSQSLAAIPDQLPSAPTFPSTLTHTLPTHTHITALSLSLPPPLFSFHYIFISLSWERAPPHRWKGGWLKAPGGKHFNSESKLYQGRRRGDLPGPIQKERPGKCQ